MIRYSGAAVAFLLLFATPAPAGVILFDNFGYNNKIGWTISGVSSTSGYNSQGESFSPSVTAPVGSIAVAISLVSGTNDVFFDLRSNNSGQPGAVIETFEAVGMMAPFGGNSSVVLTSAINPLLDSSLTYWLIARPGAADTRAAWYKNTSTNSGQHAFTTDPNGLTAFSTSTPTADPLTHSGTFQVYGLWNAPVPEPATLAVFGVMALCGGWGVRRRLRTATT